jgi:hypothetical protein
MSSATMVKCPNCNYEHYDDPPRCRGCGYTFQTQADKEKAERLDAEQQAAGTNRPKSEGESDEPPDPLDDINHDLTVEEVMARGYLADAAHDIVEKENLRRAEARKAAIPQAPVAQRPIRPPTRNSK